MGKFDGAERREAVPDWATRLLVALVGAIASAMFSVWNDNIITKQDVITLKAGMVKTEDEVAQLRSEVIRQNNHNGLILDKLEQISINSSRRKL